MSAQHTMLHRVHFNCCVVRIGWRPDRWEYTVLIKQGEKLTQDVERISGVEMIPTLGHIRGGSRACRIRDILRPFGEPRGPFLAEYFIHISFFWMIYFVMVTINNTARWDSVKLNSKKVCAEYKMRVKWIFIPKMRKQVPLYSQH